MKTIVAAVGKKGANRPHDVKVVQTLLNRQLPRLIPLARLAEDGHIGPRTISAIEEFQRRVLRVPAPDGRVDPGGTTLKRLNEGPPPPNVEAFIQKVLPAAKAVKAKWRIPVGVLIAQTALETGWGRSVKGNAYFGIKAGAKTSNTVTFTTAEVIGGKRVTLDDQFRAYKNFDEAADDYGRFLNENPLYKPCFVFVNDPDKFVEKLQQAGYATDPDYAAKLKSIIRNAWLDRFD
jgi:flagellar protein FlgJ